MAHEGWLLAGGALALLLLSRREGQKDQPPRSGSGPQKGPGPKPGTAPKDKCAHTPPSQKETDDSAWLPALLSEYHPDAPADQQRMEGGKYDRNPRQKTLVITVEQFSQDKSKYPYVSVSGDLTLRGKPVPYGARVYFSSFPDIVFRLVDTGDRFRGATKCIRKDDHEPFDIATNYGSKLGFAGKAAFYRIDRRDLLPNAAPKRA